MRKHRVSGSKCGGEGSGRCAELAPQLTVGGLDSVSMVLGVHPEVIGVN